MTSFIFKIIEKLPKGTSSFQGDKFLEGGPFYCGLEIAECGLKFIQRVPAAFSHTLDQSARKWCTVSSRLGR
jgi:hypothetical protein